MLWIQVLFFVGLTLLYQARSVHPHPHHIFEALHGRGHKHEFHYANEGKFVHYSYEVEKSQNVIHLEDVAGMKTVRCQKTSLTLTFKDDAAASEAMERHSWEAGRVVTGRNKNCAKTVMDKIVSFERRGEVLRLSTVPALLNEAFVNANIKLKTNMNPKEIKPENLRPASFENPKSVQKEINKRGLISSFFNVLSSFAHTIANVVEEIINVVETSWDVLIEGEFSGVYNHTWQGPSWNYDWDKGRCINDLLARNAQYNPEMPWLTCENCYFYSDLVFEFELIVHRHHLIVFKMINQLDVELNLEYALNVSLSKQGTIDFPLGAPKTEYTFYVYGIPIFLTLSTPISFGVDWDMQIATQIKGRSKYLYKAIFGYQYVENENSGSIFETSNEHYGNITNAQLNASAKAMVYLQATFLAQITGIGKLFIGARAGIEIGIEDNSDLCENEYSFNSGWVFLVSRGGELNILGAIQKEFKTKTLYRKRGNIESGCLIGSVFTPSTVVIGASWSGSAYRDNDNEACAGSSVLLDWNLDLVARDKEVYYFAFSESDVFQNSEDCLGGHIYVAGPPSKIWKLRYIPLPDSEYFECTNDNSELIPPAALILDCSSDYSKCVPQWGCSREWDKISFTSPFVDCIPTDISCPLRRDLAYFRQHNSESQK